MHFNYGGNWTALFTTGDRFPPPPELAAHTYIFKGSDGFDGQFYRYMAHDPWIRQHWTQSFDLEPVRYDRILVPALAWLLAAGRDRYIDASYVALILGSIFLGVFWLAGYAAELGRHPAWGLAFLLVPATLVAADRMTVDVVMVALCVPLLRYAKKPQVWPLYLVLATAVLLRDTGVMLIVAVCGYELARRQWQRVVIFAAAVLPAAVWYFYARYRLDAIGVPRSIHGLTRQLFQNVAIGVFFKLFHPDHYAFSPLVNRAVQFADVMSLCGFLALLAAGIWSLRRIPWDIEQWVIVSFAALILVASAPYVWGNVFNYGRQFSVLIFFTALGPLRNGAWWPLVAVILMTLRVGVQLAPQALGILHGLTS